MKVILTQLLAQFKIKLKPWLKKSSCIGRITSVYISRMEYGLDVYERSYDPEYPVVCVDEKPCQLLGDIVVPMPVKSAKPKKIDFHCKRHGKKPEIHGKIRHYLLDAACMINILNTL